MKIDQNPFSLYDFLGYFIPGALMIYFIFLIPLIDSGGNVLTYFDQIKVGNWEAYLPFIILAYIIGHLQSFVSSYTIERFCLWRYSYPFRFLMSFKHDGYINRDRQSKFEISKRIVLWLLIFPVSSIDLIVGKFLKLNYLHNKKFSVQTRNIIVNKLRKFVITETGHNMEVDIEDPDNFALIYHYTLENSKSHQQKFINYVALYGFSRSLSFILTTVFWYFIYFNFKFQAWDIYRICYLLILGLLAYLFYLNFCKFYRRFSMEVILTFITL